MKNLSPITLGLTLLFLANFAPSARAQEVPIPDPGLNAAIREALQKPQTDTWRFDAAILPWQSFRFTAEL